MHAKVVSMIYKFMSINFATDIEENYNKSN